MYFSSNSYSDESVALPFALDQASVSLDGTISW